MLHIIFYPIAILIIVGLIILFVGSFVSLDTKVKSQEIDFNLLSKSDKELVKMHKSGMLSYSLLRKTILYKIQNGIS